MIKNALQIAVSAAIVVSSTLPSAHARNIHQVFRAGTSFSPNALPGLRLAEPNLRGSSAPQTLETPRIAAFLAAPQALPAPTQASQIQARAKVVTAQPRLNASPKNANPLTRFVPIRDPLSHTTKVRKASKISTYGNKAIAQTGGDAFREIAQQPGKATSTQLDNAFDNARIAAKTTPVKMEHEHDKGGALKNGLRSRRQSEQKSATDMLPTPRAPKATNKRSWGPRIAAGIALLASMAASQTAFAGEAASSTLATSPALGATILLAKLALAGALGVGISQYLKQRWRQDQTQTVMLLLGSAALMVALGGISLQVDGTLGPIYETWADSYMRSTAFIRHISLITLVLAPFALMSPGQGPRSGRRSSPRHRVLSTLALLTTLGIGATAFAGEEALGLHPATAVAIPLIQIAIAGLMVGVILLILRLKGGWKPPGRARRFLGAMVLLAATAMSSTAVAGENPYLDGPEDVVGLGYLLLFILTFGSLFLSMLKSTFRSNGPFRSKRSSKSSRFGG